MCSRISKMVYAIAHRKEVRRLYVELTGTCPLRAYLHDMDKVVLLCIGFSPKTASRIHRAIASHHDTTTTSHAVLVEMAIDWESARYTKPDKPLNARDTLSRYYPQMSSAMCPVLDELGL